MLVRPFPTVPPIEAAGAIFARTAKLLRAPKDLTVSQYAVEAMGYDPDLLPWQPEIMDALGHESIAEVDLMGPVQIGKSEIGLAWLGYSVEQDVADFMVCQPDKTLAHDFVVRRINPAVEKTPRLRDQLVEDSIWLKKFRGMLLTSIWPVAAQFRARPVPRAWLDDFDQIPGDIEGQGSPHKLISARATSFEGREKVFASSSPANDDGGGIQGRVEAGSNERLWVRCPSCRDWFAPDLERDLKFDEKGTPDEAEASAWVACAANGCELKPEKRRELLASMLELPTRGWLEPHQRVENKARGPVIVGERTWKRRRGFRVDGLLALSSWGRLARELREAQQAWETRQDESELRAFYQIRAGRNYRSKLAAAKAVDLDELLARRESSWRLGEIPAGVGVRVLTASVDTQTNRWEVKVKGWGDGLESWTVDRFSVETLADGRTLVDPATHPEHWLELLERVVLKRYPMQGHPELTVPILTTGIDTGGEDGVSDNAAKFYAAAIKLGVGGDRITLLKGGNQAEGVLMPAPGYLGRRRDGRASKRGPRLYVPNVHKLKGVVDARVRRSSPGPGYIHWPDDYAEEHFLELTAEEKKGGKWKKIRPRNEDLDLEVYGYAVLLRPPFLGQSRSTFSWVPRDFRVPELARPAGEDGTPAVVPSTAAGDIDGGDYAGVGATPAEEAKAAAPAPRQAKRTAKPARPGRVGGWMGRLKH